MLAILGALLGVLGSLLPEVLKFFNNKEDHKHELAVLNVQAQMAMSEHAYRLEEINAQADIATEQAVYKAAEVKTTGWQFIDGINALYNSTVRPTITYAFMFLYAYVKYSMIYGSIQAGYKWQEVGLLIWGAEDFAIFSTIMGFWFGGRLMKNMLDRIEARNGGNGGYRGHSQPALVSLGKRSPLPGIGDAAASTIPNYEPPKYFPADRTPVR